MKVINLNLLNRMDHDDVKENAGHNEGQRKKYRIKIIKKFISWSKQNKDQW